ncbi:twin-arginine translocase TatA/TatE family subunit [Haloprofundus sp. MHR1]|uniref:twin-arginine translocase TatA/TatE family subunit n=1 Tax=Haloprofundus sp. MHR1 TaxID=2572921 RepID=UPI0010BF474E|nr:twin-arginine translocase TatA/TatE family subunit [Haloprofundus sp. MHR1]QCJ47849.1 twin-arginine translocase TatA/TatE family subunit [Haloprofundus sp. MHR1]
MGFILFGGLPGGPEMLIILLIVVLLFGANKLPELARSTGQAMGEFQRGREETEQELRRSSTPSPSSTASDRPGAPSSATVGDDTESDAVSDDTESDAVSDDTGTDAVSDDTESESRSAN